LSTFTPAIPERSTVSPECTIAIQVGGIGARVPEHRAALARLGLPAMLAGTLPNLPSACIAVIAVIIVG